jgi:BON domain
VRVVLSATLIAKERKMAEQQAERRRVIVETPTARREVEHSEAVRYPERTGASGALMGAVAVAVVALAAIAILFLMNRQQDMNANVAQQQPPNVVVQQPAEQPPNVVVQQPAPATQPAPVIVNNPGTASGGSASTGANDDSAVQAAVDRKLSNDPALSSLGITAMVMNGKTTLMGTVHSEAEKARVERAVRAVKGVRSIDNQISVQP